MTQRVFVFAATVLTMAVVTNLQADEVRYYQGDDGRTYRETRRVVQRPVSETRIQEREVPIYREQLTTQYLDSHRTYVTPVTEYRWEPQLKGRWNPLVTPYYQHRLVPRTRWETRIEPTQIPVVRREMVADSRIERTPITTRRMVDEEHISRVAVNDGSNSSDPFASSTSVARRQQIGGVKLDNDPPRRGASTDWQMSRR